MNAQLSHQSRQTSERRSANVPFAPVFLWFGKRCRCSACQTLGYRCGTLRHSHNRWVAALGTKYCFYLCSDISVHRWSLLFSKNKSSNKEKLTVSFEGDGEPATAVCSGLDLRENNKRKDFNSHQPARTFESLNPVQVLERSDPGLVSSEKPLGLAGVEADLNHLAFCSFCKWTLVGFTSVWTQADSPQIKGRRCCKLCVVIQKKNSKKLDSWSEDWDAFLLPVFALK